MVDEGILRQRIARGERVQRLLDSDDFSATIPAMEADCVERWKVATDEAERNKQWHRFKAISGIEEQLRRHVRDGDAARLQLRDLETTGEND